MTTTITPPTGITSVPVHLSAGHGRTWCGRSGITTPHRSRATCRACLTTQERAR